MLNRLMIDLEIEKMLIYSFMKYYVMEMNDVFVSTDD